MRVSDSLKESVSFIESDAYEIHERQGLIIFGLAAFGTRDVT